MATGVEGGSEENIARGGLRCSCDACEMRGFDSDGLGLSSYVAKFFLEVHGGLINRYGGSTSLLYTRRQRQIEIFLFGNEKNLGWFSRLEHTIPAVVRTCMRNAFPFFV
jgi:hypothetical protein